MPLQNSGGTAAFLDIKVAQGKKRPPKIYVSR